MPAELTSDLPQTSYQTQDSSTALHVQPQLAVEATSSSPLNADNTNTANTNNTVTNNHTSMVSVTPTISTDSTAPSTTPQLSESARLGIADSSATNPSSASNSLAPSPSTAPSYASTASLAHSTPLINVAPPDGDVSSSHSSVSDDGLGGGGLEEEDNEEDGSRRIRTPHGPELLGLSKLPFQMIQVPLPWQHAVSRNECKLLSVEQKNLMVQRPVRVMLCSTPPCGPDANGRLVLTPANIWFVAKDVAQLLHIHEANVARRIAPFLPHERARMPVQCMQSNGTKATLMLSVLSVAGMTRLLTASKKAVMGVRLHTFLTSYVNQLCLSPPLYSTVTQQTLTLMQSPSATTLTLHPSALSHTNPSPALAAHLMQYQMNPTGLIPLPMPAVTAAAAAAVAAANAASNAAAYQQAAAYRASMGAVNMMMPPPPPPVNNDPYAVYHVKSEMDQLIQPNSKKQYLPYHLAASHSAAAASQQYVQMQHMPPPPPSYPNNHGNYGASYYNSVSQSAGPYPPGNWNSGPYNSNGYPPYGAPYSYPPPPGANGNGNGSVSVNSSSYPLPTQPPSNYQFHSGTMPMHTTSISTPPMGDAQQPLRSDIVKSEQCSSPSTSASPPMLLHTSSISQLQLVDGTSELLGASNHSHRALKRPHS